MVLEVELQLLLQIVLDRDKEIYRPGEEISIASGVVRSPMIKDYRSVVKVNDIIGLLEIIIEQIKLLTE